MRAIMSSESVSRRSLLLSAAAIATAKPSAAQTGNAELERFIEDVRATRSERDRQAAVEEVLRRAVSEPRSVLKALGEDLSAGIHPMYKGNDLTILNVVWAPLMVLLPHNHNMWASIGIYTGREDNILWERLAATLTATRAASLSEKDVFGLPSDAIHSVTNPIGRLTGAIHIYGGDFFASGRSEWDAETLRERPWDLDAVRDEFRKASQRFDAADAG